MNGTKILLAGDGHGVLSGYIGLMDHFSHIDILTNTPELFEPYKIETKRFVCTPFESDAEVFLGCAYKSIVKADLLRSKKCLNVHYAVLPRYRGMHPIVWGILNDEKYLGWTLHEMDEGIDSGDVIYQHKVLNDFKSTAWSYMLQFDKAVEECLGGVITNYLDGKIMPSKQNQDCIMWGCKRNLDDCKINFTSTNAQIVNVFRALNAPYPYPFFVYRAKKYFVHEYKIIPTERNLLTNGRIANIDSTGVYIRILEGYLIATKILDEQGQITPYNTFQIGSRL